MTKLLMIMAIMAGLWLLGVSGRANAAVDPCGEVGGGFQSVTGQAVELSEQQCGAVASAPCTWGYGNFIDANGCPVPYFAPTTSCNFMGPGELFFSVGLPLLALGLVRVRRRSEEGT